MTDRNRTSRYLVFAYSHHYPKGGWGDYNTSSESLTGAVEIAKALRQDGWHIVDLNAAEIVAEGFDDKQYVPAPK